MAELHADMDRVSDLAVRYFDGLLDDAEFAELSATLRCDRGAARLFNDLCLNARTLFEANAPHQAAGGTVEGLVGTSKLETPNAKLETPVAGRIGFTRIAVAAALLIAGAGVAAYLLVPHSEFRVPSSAPVATVIDVRDAVWASEPLHGGQELAADPIELESGSAEVLLTGGATVRISGPARLTLAGVNRVALSHGRLAVSGVPGFAVDGPGFSVVDLGTAFTVDAKEAGRASVWVTRGRVELRRAGVEPLLLERGHAIARDEAGVWGPMRSDELPPTEHDPVLWLAGGAGVKAGESGRVVEWTEPGLVPREDSDVTVKPASAASPIATDRGVVRFDERSGPLLTSAIRLGDSQTLAAVFTDAAIDDQPRQVLNTNGPPNAVIETVGSPRRVRVRLFAGKSTPESAIQSEPFQSGQPVAVVFVADAESGQMRLWVNGVMSESAALPHPIAQRSVKSIGGHPGGAARFLGDIGQVLIFDAALGDDEASALCDWMSKRMNPAADR